MSELTDLISYLQSVGELPSSVTAGSTGHLQGHISLNQRYNKLSKGMLTLAQLLNSGSAGSSPTTPAPTASAGSDMRTQVDYARGIPVKPAGVVAQVLNDTRYLVGSDTGSDGVIRIPKGWYVKEGNPFDPYFGTNCGSIPVVIDQGAVIITPQGYAIGSGNDVNLTVKDAAIYSTDTAADGNTVRPRAIVANRPTKVDISYVTMESTGGIYVDHLSDQTGSKNLTFSNIKSRNIIGTNGQSSGGSGDYRSVIQINSARTAGYIRNVENINEPDKSRVEDQINLYDAGGPDENTLFQCDGLYLQGSWPVPRTSTQSTQAMFSIDGAGGSSASPGTSNTRTNNLWCVAGGNAACNIAIGHNNIVDGLYAVSSGYFADGSPSFCTYSGCAVIDYYNTGTALNNFIRNPKVGWIRTKDTPASQRVRLDVSPSSLQGGVIGLQSIVGDITLETERQAFLQWVNFLNLTGQTVGSRAIF